MKFLQFRHMFAHGYGEFQIMMLHDDDMSDEDIKDTVSSLADEYNYSDKYRGIDYAVLNHPPKKWLMREIRRTADRITYMGASTYLLPTTTGDTAMTALQTAMIIKIARDEYNAINGAMPSCKEETETWREMIIESKQDKGTFTSLLNAGLVWSNGRGKDAACGLTEAGFAAFMELATKHRVFDLDDSNLLDYAADG